MRITVISFGHRRDDLYQAALDAYAKRIAKPWSLHLVDLPSARQSNNAPAATVMAKEALALRDHGVDVSKAWLLEVGGQAFSTEALAESLRRGQDGGEKERVFVIGGADGLDPGLGREAKQKFSLSRLTLPHRLARVVLVEQLYRAQTIVRGEPYHK